ncbi:C40 family peptidase [Latilactobacillus sp. 5-91]|uniref:C40 family peptidase n=1 Tax=Latilactobacillus sp. 5-91 TaxID=3410924 RepID=UPI003C79234F
MKVNKKLLVLLAAIGLSLGGTGLISNGLTNTTPVQAAAMNSKQQAVVNLAKQQVGKPYVWGATGPNSFDCSGLVQYVYSHAAGINLPRVTTQQEKSGSEVSLSALQPGDLLFWGSRGSTYHVAIYIGDGNFVQAPQPGQNVKITNMKYYYPSFARRVLPTELPAESPKPAQSESTARVTANSTFGYRSSGAQMSGTNNVFKKGTNWKVNGFKMINGQEMLLVGGDEYIPRKDTTIDNSILEINYYSNLTVNTYKKDGTLAPNKLKTGTKWKNSGFTTIKGQVMYQVGRDVYLPKLYTQFGASGPKPAQSESTARITVNSTFGYRSSGAQMSGTNNVFKKGTNWKVCGLKMINGQEMILVGGDEYIPRKDTTIDNRVVEVNYIPGQSVPTYKLDGTMAIDKLKNGTKWKNSGFRMINNEQMYQVSTNEYLPKKFTQFGHVDF